MANLEELAETIKSEGYSTINAQARVCQDIVLKAISKSSLSRNVTIKGGVVMRSITGDARRATRDMDLDFIRYSLSEKSIKAFVDKINCIDGIKINVTGDIEELSQQEYRGKRAYVIIEDNTGHSLMSKIDFGVHKQIQIEQDEYCFDVCLDDVGASLLINSKEQIFTEKLRSLLRFGPLSTRYKDVFDMYYLSESLDSMRLADCIQTYIFNDPEMLENDMGAIIKRVKLTFDDKLYRSNIEKSNRANWLDATIPEVFNGIIKFLETFTKT